MKEDDADRQIDSVLEDLVVGNITPDDPRVRRLLETSERFRREWMSLQQVQDRLRIEDEERDAILDEIRSSSMPEDSRLSSAFRHIAASSASAPVSRDESGEPAPAIRQSVRSRRWQTYSIVAAAAILVAVIWIPWSDLLSPDPRGGGEQWVGPDLPLLVDLEPRGAVSAEAYRRFRWRAPENLNIEYYQVRILERDEGGELRPFKESTKLRTNSYEARFELPPRIRWHVRALDVAGVVVAQGEADARLATP